MNQMHEFRSAVHRVDLQSHTRGNEVVSTTSLPKMVITKNGNYRARGNEADVLVATLVVTSSPDLNSINIFKQGGAHRSKCAKRLNNSIRNLKIGTLGSRTWFGELGGR